MQQLTGLKKDTLLLDYCWICNERFTTSKPPGRANREDHHIVPRNAGGTDGPEVSLCDTHHAVVHKIASKAKSGKAYKDFLQSETSESAKKLLWLASIIFRAERSVVDDPNKKLRNGISLSKIEVAMIGQLKNVYPGLNQSDILKLALANLFKRHFAQ